MSDVIQSDDDLAEMAYGPGYDKFRNKWIGDHEGMNADLVRWFVPRLASEADLRAKLDVAVEALNAVKGIKSLLPPAAVDSEMMEGWCDGQMYLALNIAPVIDTALATIGGTNDRS